MSISVAKFNLIRCRCGSAIEVGIIAFSVAMHLTHSVEKND